MKPFFWGLKIADVPFPLPFAQLLLFLLVVFSLFVPLYLGFGRGSAPFVGMFYSCCFLSMTRFFDFAAHQSVRSMWWVPLHKMAAKSLKDVFAHYIDASFFAIWLYFGEENNWQICPVYHMPSGVSGGMSFCKGRPLVWWGSLFGLQRTWPHCLVMFVGIACFHIVLSHDA